MMQYLLVPVVHILQLQISQAGNRSSVPQVLAYPSKAWGAGLAVSVPKEGCALLLVRKT